MTADAIRWDSLLRRLDQFGRESFVAEGVQEHHGEAGVSTSHFIVTRQRTRWLLEAPSGVLRLVGDGVRDLVPEDGGLMRLPAGTGWEREPAGLLLQPHTWAVGLDALADHVLLAGPDPDRIAGRPAWTVVLRVPQEGKEPYRLWIDDASGMRLACETPDLRVALQRVVFDARPAAHSESLLQLLDVVPDVKLAPIAEVPDAARPHVRAVASAAGKHARVSLLSFPGEGSFAVLVHSDAHPIAIFDRRAREHAPDYRCLLGRVWRWGAGQWEYSLDTTKDDSEARTLASALARSFAESEV